MRSRANFSASSAARSQARAAATISAGSTRNPSVSRSTRSNFRLRSISAASPRLATSAMIARTFAAPSSAVSRLTRRNAWKRSAKSGALASRRIGIGHPGAAPVNGAPSAAQSTPSRSRVERMVRTSGRRPRRTEVGELGFEALDVEPQRGIAGKHQGDEAGRRIGRGELDGEQVQYRVGIIRRNVPALDREHPVEPQGCAAAAEAWGGIDRRFPVEPIEAQHQPALGRPPHDVADLEHRILQMGRDDLDVVVVERNELEEIHGRAPAPKPSVDVGSDAPALPQEPPAPAELQFPASLRIKGASRQLGLLALPEGYKGRAANSACSPP